MQSLHPIDKKSWIENLFFLLTQECSVRFPHSVFACCAYMEVNCSAHSIFSGCFSSSFSIVILFFKALTSHSVKGLFKPCCGTCLFQYLFFSYVLRGLTFWPTDYCIFFIIDSKCLPVILCRPLGMWAPVLPFPQS